MADGNGDSRRLLSIVQVNCQDLKAGSHYEDFKRLFMARPADIICVAESWLSAEIYDSMYGLPGYEIFRRDRAFGAGGGVAVFVDKSMKARVVASSADGDKSCVDFLILEICVRGGAKLLLGAVYRPPKVGGINRFFEAIVELYPMYNRLVVIGDFNSNMLREYHDSEVIRRFVDINDLFLVPLEPTFRGGGGGENASLIDLCVMDCEENFVSVEQEPTPFSGHDCVRVTYDLEVESGGVGERVARDFRKLNTEALLRDLGNADWRGFYASSSVDFKVEFLNEVVTNCFDVHAPVRRFKGARRPTMAWMSDRIGEVMKERDRARRAHRASCKVRRTSAGGTVTECIVKGDADKLEKFKALRNCVKRMVRDAKRKFYGEALSRVKNSKAAWQRLRQLGLLRSRGEGQELAVSVDELNEFFASTSAPGDSQSGTTQRREFDESRFFFEHVTEEVLTKAISRASCCSPGADGVSMAMVNIALPVIFRPLYHLFNFSLQTSSFPDIWKCALIRPIPKVKSPVGPADYRPISLLCALSKLLERIVEDQLSAFLEARGLLDPFQSAYRKGHNTQTALIRISDYVTRGMDSRQLTGMVLFDFSKAFDRVRHDLLLIKLVDLRVSDSVVSWFAEYLSGRSQAVLSKGDSRSRFISNSAGVPQGSVLGPLLFSLYTADLRWALSTCDYNLYADDLQIFCKEAAGDVDLIGKRLNRDILMIRIWAATNGLILNSEKTHAILFGNSVYVRGLSGSQVPALVNGRAVVPFERSVKVLGVVLSDDFRWREQAVAVAKAINACLYRLKVCRNLLPTDARIALVRALVNPIVDYCSVLLYGISGELSRIIDVALNSCVRFIFDVDRFQPISPYYRRVGWLRVEERRELNLMCAAHAVLSEGRPLYLRRLFTWEEMRGIVTREGGRRKLRIARFRTEVRRSSFCVAAAYGWNALPSETVGLSRGEFRAALRGRLARGERLIPVVS